MNYLDNIKLAIRALKGNMLRSILTLLMIVIGITALIGILTAIEAIKLNMTQNFVSLGAAAFTIQDSDGIRRGGKRTENPAITFQEAEEFQKLYTFPSTVSLSAEINSTATIKSTFEESNPNVTIEAADGNYIKVSGKTIGLGRAFSPIEISSGSNVAILGYDLGSKVFQHPDSVVGSIINIEAKKYTVIGMLEAKGASAGSNDNFAIIPYLNAKKEFDISEASFNIIVEANNTDEIDWAVDEAAGIFRRVRKLEVTEDDNFHILKSDKIASTLIEQLQFVSYATILIGMLTLIGAGVGLMNIMLVSVNERTREIGISKSLGATKRTIFMQFLIEAITICVFGGILGVVFGVFLGNLLGIFMGVGFIFPVAWVVMGLIFCTTIGLVAGVYPASRASNLNPVEALRHE